MYSILPSFVLGFHGCDESVAEAIFCNQSPHLQASQNTYDWLGHGVYFWENSPARAQEFAELRARYPARKSGPRIRKPAVAGAIINLGYCLNLMDSKYFAQVRQAYGVLKNTCGQLGESLPRNRSLRGGRDLLLRDLDCNVINLVHQLRRDVGERPFDSVRSAFIEGEPLYEGGMFRDKNHIQICVRNRECIKRYFRPLTANAGGRVG